MKKTLKKLLPVLLAAIVIFAYLGNWTGEQTADYQNVSTSSVTILQEADETPQVLPENEPESAEAPEEPDPAETEEAAPQEEAAEAESAEVELPDEEIEEASAAQIDEDGVYTTKEDVALYIHTYGRLPSNFITKKEAEAAGWPGGNLEPYCPGKCIGGSYFGNYEGLLPDKEGRTWTECDIDTLGAKSRGAKRIIFSNDGLIYYTGDHYESFELLYGEP